MVTIMVTSRVTTSHTESRDPALGPWATAGRRGGDRPSQWPAGTRPAAAAGGGGPGGAAGDRATYVTRDEYIM